MIIVIGSITTTQDTEAEILRLSREHVVRSRAESGCISHNVHIDCENSNRVVFVEYWTDGAALKAHFAVPESQQFASTVGRLSATPAEIKVFNADELDMR